MCPSMYEKGQLAFSESQQQLGNLGNKIPHPKIFGNLNFQLRNLNRSSSAELAIIVFTGQTGQKPYPYFSDILVRFYLVILN